MNKEINFILTFYPSFLLGSLIGVLMTIYASPMTAELEELRAKEQRSRAPSSTGSTVSPSDSFSNRLSQDQNQRPEQESGQN